MLIGPDLMRPRHGDIRDQDPVRVGAGPLSPASGPSRPDPSSGCGETVALRRPVLRSDHVHRNPAPQVNRARPQQCRSEDGPAAVHRARDGQHHRRRHLQPSVRHRVLRADQPGRDGPGHASAPSRWRSCSRCCRGASPPTGGPYAYARAAFGNGFGFSQAWSYWITAWAGNAAIVVGWVFYVENFVNKGGSTAWSILIALVGLWIPAAVNLTGVRNMGVFQVWTTVLKFIPLALMATVGLFFIEAGNFTPWNTSGDTNLRRHRRRDGDLPVQLPGRRDRRGRRRQGAQPRAQRAQGHDLRHARQRRGLHALADRSVRDPARRPPSPRTATRRRTPPPPTPSPEAPGLGNIVAVARHHLRDRRPERLDDDLRRDAAGRGQGRPVPEGVRARCPSAACRRSASSPRRRSPRSPS